MALQQQYMKGQNSSIAVHRKEAFDIGYRQYFKTIDNSKISAVLNNKERNIRFNDITYRQLNSWENEGLLTNGREDRSWRRFSIMDAVWIKILHELRSFGMGWEQIKNAKDSLAFESEVYGVAMPILEFYTAFAIGNKMPVLLLVFKDGVCVPANYTQYKVAREYSEVDNHLQINLNAILQSFFPTVDLKPKSNHEIPVEVDEMELLAFLRLGNYEKIEIKYSKGKIETILGTERFANEKVFDALKQKEYSEILVRKNDDGIVTSLIAKRKKKL